MASGVPVDVEEGRERRRLAPFEDVEPPPVLVPADPHMVGDKIEDEAHAALVQARDERGEIGFSPDLGLSLL